MNSKDWQLGIEYEYTGKDTPQRNKLVELGFATDAKRGCAMMNKVNIPKDMWYQLFRKCFKTDTATNNLCIETIGEETKTRYKHFGKEVPRFVKNLQEWGKAGTITTRKDGKLNNSGATCIFVGYAEDHSGNVFRIFNPIT